MDLFSLGSWLLGEERSGKWGGRNRGRLKSDPVWYPDGRIIGSEISRVPGDQQHRVNLSRGPYNGIRQLDPMPAPQTDGTFCHLLVQVDHSEALQKRLSGMKQSGRSADHYLDPGDDTHRLVLVPPDFITGLRHPTQMVNHDVRVEQGLHHSARSFF